MNRRLENALADVEFRLQQLESGLPPEGIDAVDGDEGTDAADPADEAGKIDAAEGEVSEVVDDPDSPENNPDAYLAGETPEEQFDNAFTLVRRNQLDDAIPAFRAFLAKYPEHSSRSNATYWLGKSYFVKGNYTEAAKIFVDGVANYAGSSKGADFMLHLGLSLAELGQADEACGAFQELDRRYPNADAGIKERRDYGRQVAGCV